MGAGRWKLEDSGLESYQRLAACNVENGTSLWQDWLANYYFVTQPQPIWVFSSIEVWSRLWTSTVVGRRSYHNTLDLFRDVSSRMNLERIPLITKDAFEFYEKVIRRVFGLACLYGQVIKMRRNDHVVKVERRIRIGSAWRWEQALRDSEDSSQLNTSFVERLNLTIRQGSAYLCRRTSCQARWKQRLEDHLDLLRCQANAFGSLTTFGGGSTEAPAT